MGDDSVTFGVDQAMKHARYSDDMALSVDMLEELMEEWKEDKPNKSTVTFEDEFDGERDLMEIKRLLEEAKYNELIRRVESPPRRVASTDSPSPFEKTRSVTNFAWDSTSPLIGLDVFSIQNTKFELKILPNHLEYAFREHGQQKPVIIASDLAKHEKESHIMEDNRYQRDKSRILLS